MALKREYVAVYDAIVRRNAKREEALKAGSLTKLFGHGIEQVPAEYDAIQREWWVKGWREEEGTK